jgi:hypothetical protein
MLSNKKKEKQRKFIKNIYLWIIDKLIICLIATISVYVSIKISFIKMDIFMDRVGLTTLCMEEVWFNEYSLTVGFLSIILFCLLNSYYRIIKRKFTKWIKC